MGILLPTLYRAVTALATCHRFTKLKTVLMATLRFNHCVCAIARGRQYRGTLYRDNVPRLILVPLSVMLVLFQKCIVYGIADTFFSLFCSVLATSFVICPEWSCNLYKDRGNQVDKE